MTRSRKEILSILAESGEPLSALDVSRRFPAEKGPDQATVYRALHWLEERGWAESFILHCTSHGTERYYSAVSDQEGKPMPHRHWFHCEECHRFTDLGDCGLEELFAEYEKSLSLRIKAHALYCTGTCASCGSSLPREPASPRAPTSI